MFPCGLLDRTINTDGRTSWYGLRKYLSKQLTHVFDVGRWKHMHLSQRIGINAPDAGYLF